jgi:hypothetical protein
MDKLEKTLIENTLLKAGKKEKRISFWVLHGDAYTQ